MADINDPELCLICTNYNEVMTHLYQVITCFAQCSVADVLQELNFLTIPDNHYMERKLCFVCLGKVQTCYEFKSICRQTEYLLKKPVPDITPIIKIESSDESESEDVIFDESRNKAEIVNSNISNFQQVEQVQEHNEEFYDDKTENEIVKEKHIIECDNQFDLNNADEDLNVKNDAKTPLKIKQRERKKELICSHCQKTFSRKAQLLNHMRCHKGNNTPFECEICHRKFARECNLHSHRVVHAKKCKFKCTVCSKVFMRKEKLITHMRIHTGEKPYKCSMCSESFIRSDYLLKHKRRSHVSNYKIKCNICHVLFTEHSHLIMHMESYHETMLSNG